jgi:hypothetical protein
MPPMLLVNAKRKIYVDKNQLLCYLTHSFCIFAPADPPLIEIH